MEAKKETRNWLCTLVVWVVIVMKQLPESRENHVANIYSQIVFGIVGFALPMCAVVLFPEMRGWVGAGAGAVGFVICMRVGAARSLQVHARTVKYDSVAAPGKAILC